MNAAVNAQARRKGTNAMHDTYFLLILASYSTRSPGSKRLATYLPATRVLLCLLEMPETAAAFGDTNLYNQANLFTELFS